MFRMHEGLSDRSDREETQMMSSSENRSTLRQRGVAPETARSRRRLRKADCISAGGFQ